MLNDIIELYAFNRWAHERTLRAAATLTDEQYARPLGNSFSSLRATLEHLLLAEAIWLGRWQGTPSGASAPDLTECVDASLLRTRWQDHWQRQSEFLNQVGEADLARRIDIRLRSGIETRQALADAMRHVVNHASYHRGQATTLVRQLGGTPVAMDLFTYYMLRDGGQLGVEQ